MIRFGVIGYGYWGPNIVRNLDLLEETEVLAVCDKSPTSRRRIEKAHPHVRVTADAEVRIFHQDPAAKIFKV